MERCTHCRARLAPGQEVCQRCGMELGRLRQVMAEAAILDKSAAIAILDGDMQQAEQLLEQRLCLRREMFIEEFLAFVKAV